MKEPYQRVRYGNRYVRAHRVRAELALGRPLRGTECVHHADGTKDTDAPLVICPDESYHRLLHTRTAVVRLGGNPNTERVCCHCQKCKPYTEFLPSGKHPYCRSCKRAYERAHRKRS